MGSQVVLSLQCARQRSCNGSNPAFRTFSAVAAPKRSNGSQGLGLLTKWTTPISIWFHSTLLADRILTPAL